MKEIKQWSEYCKRRGSLNIGRRVEQAIAEAVAFNYNCKVPEDKYIDPLELMPHEDDVIVSFEEQLAD